MTIGILALQGGVREHADMLQKSGAEVRLVKNPEDLKDISGIIFPGGESTAIGKLLHKNNLFTPLQKLISNGLPAWGTCAGAILLAKKGSEYSLRLGDFDVQRNAYGAQLGSFEKKLKIEGIGEKFPALFIRAPQFERIGKDVEVLSEINGSPVFIRDKNIWASTFHPELSDDSSVHKAFVEFCCS